MWVAHIHWESEHRHNILMKLFFPSIYLFFMNLGLAIGIKSMVGIGCCCCCAIKGMFCAQFCLKMWYKAHPKKNCEKKDLPIELGFCNVPLLRNNGCSYERTSTVDYIQSHTVNLCENIHISVVVRYSRTPQPYTHRETNTHVCTCKSTPSKYVHIFLHNHRSARLLRITQRFTYTHNPSIWTRVL